MRAAMSRLTLPLVLPLVLLQHTAVADPAGAEDSPLMRRVVVPAVPSAAEGPGWEEIGRLRREIEAQGGEARSEVPGAFSALEQGDVEVDSLDVDVAAELESQRLQAKAAGLDAAQAAEAAMRRTSELEREVAGMTRDLRRAVSMARGARAHSVADHGESLLATTEAIAKELHQAKRHHAGNAPEVNPVVTEALSGVPGDLPWASVEHEKITSGGASGGGASGESQIGSSESYDTDGNAEFGESPGGYSVKLPPGWDVEDTSPLNPNLTAADHTYIQNAAARALKRRLQGNPEPGDPEEDVESPRKKGGLSTGAIVGISVAGFVVCGGCCGGIWLCFCRRRSKNKSQLPEPPADSDLDADDDDAAVS